MWGPYYSSAFCVRPHTPYFLIMPLQQPAVWYFIGRLSNQRHHTVFGVLRLNRNAMDGNGNFKFM